MSRGSEYPVLAFVWQPKDITSAVLETARRTRTTAVLDVSSLDLNTAAAALLRADVGGGSADVKIDSKELVGPYLKDFLQETGIGGVWAELHPLLLDSDLSAYLTELENLSDDCECYPVVGDIDLINILVNEHPRIRNIVLKGSEAGGFVSAENLLTLFSVAKNLIHTQANPPRILLWGGIATPEAAAAFLAVGVKGIVFESIHWLTDLVSMDDSVREKISRLRPEHTDLTGLNLGAPCRLFNKGNSRAVKELKEFAGSLCGSEIRDEQRRFFAERICKESLNPLDSNFSREELLPLGVEATFAHSFVQRFGTSTDQALENFLDEIDRRLSKAPSKQNVFAEGPVIEEMGTRYALVQGAMSWITDVPEFASKVAEAGALPTLALGLMPPDLLDNKLGSLKTLMGDMPFAVNVITLKENPFRDEQLAWIKSQKPRFAVIAAGEPSHATELLKSGIEVIYIAPNEKLLELAFGAGVRYVICEGNEAGGHVGEHSTLTLAQIILNRKTAEPELFQGRRIILAGGVCDRETAFVAAMLGADAVQVGTSYLATREIVETGALSDLYQRTVLEAKPGSTVVTGEGTGLRVRSLKTPKIEAVCALERDFVAGSTDEAAFRGQIEQLSAGSLFIAARAMDSPDGAALDDQTCLEQGQFMSGACAGVVNQVRTCAELHFELAEANLEPGLPFLGPIREALAERPPLDATDSDQFYATSVSSRIVTGEAARERVAVTGMSIVNALGNSPEEVWAASLAMRSGIVNVPASKWPHEKFFDPRPRVSEKTYCKVGAFQNIEVSRKELGIPPQDFRTMTDSTKITMWLAQQAIEDSGILSSDIPRHRIAVLISQNSGEAAATLEDMIIRSAAGRIVDSVKTVIEVTEETRQAIEEAVKLDRMAIDDTTLLGRLNCTAGGFICNKYGFMGPSFAVSAACATALVALYSAYQMIRNGIIDAAVIGGAEEPLTPMHFLEFSALGALAGLSGQDRHAVESSRPFDATRDGMVLGEGGGMIVVERESVARHRGAGIHAYITAMGASNNHLGMVESSRITQEIAIGACFDDAPYGPDGIDLVECHATSTMQGDVEEVYALKRFFNTEAPVVLSSFKSQIGHTLGASGVNSLIRGIMAMKEGVYPPTLNYQNPDPDMQIDGSGLSIITEPVDWVPRDSRPRRFQVNAFGFGGSNYVVQLEEATEGEDQVLVCAPYREKSPAKRPSEFPIPDGIQFFRSEISGRSYRLAVVADSGSEAVSLVGEADPIKPGDVISSKQIRALAKQGVYLGPADAQPVPLTYVFPGQGSHYAGMGHELYQNFPIIREWMDKAADVADFDILHLMFYDREEDLQKTRWQQPALFTLEFAMVKYLVSLGMTPAALAGHSLGELTALCLAGVYSFEDGFRIVNERAICMDKACGMHVDPGVMMAVNAPLDYLEEILSRTDNIYITNINSPRQVVLGGNTEAVTALGEELKAQGYRRTLLPVSMAFHSPIMRCIHDELEEFVEGIEFYEPRIPVISNTTMKPFPADTVEIKRILMAHLESPVHWMQNARTLWDDYGVRLFVEVGPRDILSNLVMDTLGEVDCIHTCFPASEIMSFRSALAQLFVKGRLQAEGSFLPFPGQERLTHRSIRPTKSAARPKTVSVTIPQGVDPVVVTQIEAFVRESFGRFLKPSLLEAIRADYDPKFSDAKLDAALSALFPGLSGAPLPRPQLPALDGVRPQPVLTAPSLSPQEKSVATETDDITEAVIGLIMDATGYERSEIEPGMDLREDLSIRSSRLPVIMDSMESHFRIKIHLEDFMEVRTIADIVEKLRELVGSDKRSAGKASNQGSTADRISQKEERADVEEPMEPIKRLVFSEVPIELAGEQPIELSSEESVVVISPVRGKSLGSKIEEILSGPHSVRVSSAAFLERDDGGSTEGLNLITDDGISKAQTWLGKVESPSGIVFVLDEHFEQKVTSPEEVSLILNGFFALLKTFINSPKKKFALLFYKAGTSDCTSSLLAEGILGSFLALGHEFASVQFRSVRVEDSTDLQTAVSQALNRQQKVVETIYRGGRLFSVEGRSAFLKIGDSSSLDLGPEDVVVLSGGAHGITYHIAVKLATFGCKLVFLGTTGIDPDVDYKHLLDLKLDSRDELSVEIRKLMPDLSEANLHQETAKISKALEIIGNVEELRSIGVETSYYRCDVTDRSETELVISQILQRYGKIDGIVHGAGILRDNFAKQMTIEDFSVVTAVKFIGAWNLFRMAQSHGLKFFTCLSSAAAIQGNPGQVNYSAGNRIMSALMPYIGAAKGPVRCKTFHLPPIEGVGMAEDEEIRALMKRMKAGYLHVGELAELFVKELLFGMDENPGVLFMRSLPDLESSLLNQAEPPGNDQDLVAGTLTFEKNDFPMIDEVSSVDVRKGELKALRSFSLEKDLWIPDHKPFKFVKHPLVSAIMAIETFMEATCLLHPELTVRAVKNAQFLDILECPPGIDRFSEILCRQISASPDEFVSEVSLATREISPTGRAIDYSSLNFKALVILGPPGGGADLEIEGFPVRKEDLDSRPMSHDEVLSWYRDRSDMQGRYIVMNSMDGSGPDSVRGRFTYPQSKDFAPPLKSRFQYSPYLLEALMQASMFYVGMRNEKDPRVMIPHQIGEIVFSRPCVSGETIAVEGRMREMNDEGLIWEARGLDQEGRTLMVLRKMVLRWFSA